MTDEERKIEEQIRQMLEGTVFSDSREKYYILVDEQVQVVDMPRWAAWFEVHDADRVIRYSVLREDVHISTVFLSLDHNYSLHGPPILFETMVFGGLLDQETRRYRTIEEAKAGHAAMVERVQRAERGESI
mgnify:CR=1 FL=1